MLRSSLRFPTRGEGALQTLLVGGGLHLLAAFVPLLPLVFVLGYLVRVLARTGEADATAYRTDLRPPGFVRIRRLLVDGLAAGVVLVAYLFVPLGVLYATVSGAARASVRPAGQGASVGFLLGSTAALALIAGVAYLLPAALAAYARRRRLRAAFDLGTLRRAATDVEYLVGWVAGAVVLGVGGALFAPLNAVALGFFVLFYAEVVAVALWGRASTAARGPASATS